MVEERNESLRDRVNLIEAQPLGDRAAGFEQLHDELLADLQSGDVTTSSAHATDPGVASPK